MHLLSGQSLVKFDRQFPIYNFFFPSQGKARASASLAEVWNEPAHPVRSRALFDLSQLREFSFEVEVKSLTSERAEAMREIGVTHPRFGLQTFSPKWREMFDLTASLEQIHDAATLLKARFPYQTFDILYGMSGQDEEEPMADLQGELPIPIATLRAA